MWHTRIIVVQLKLNSKDYENNHTLFMDYNSPVLGQYNEHPLKKLTLHMARIATDGQKIEEEYTRAIIAMSGELLLCALSSRIYIIYKKNNVKEINS